MLLIVFLFGTHYPLIKSIIFKIFPIRGCEINLHFKSTISHLVILYKHVYLSSNAFLYYSFDILATNNFYEIYLHYGILL